jgi:hypothetical protein
MRSICCGLLLMVLAAGCGWKPLFLRGPPTSNQSIPLVPASTPLPAMPLSPPVMPDQVNETNAHPMAEALRDEIDREQMGLEMQPSALPGGDKRK